MKHLVFAVFDSKVGHYLQPFHLRSIGEAQRVFSETVNDPQTNLNRYPGDFALFHIGYFDSSSGSLETLPVLENLGLAQHYLKPKVPINVPSFAQERVAEAMQQRTLKKLAARPKKKSVKAVKEASC